MGDNAYRSIDEYDKAFCEMIFKEAQRALEAVPQHYEGWYPIQQCIGHLKVLASAVSGSDPHAEVVWDFERSLSSCLDIKGELVPEDILKECQKKALVTVDDQAVWGIFVQVLDFIHRKRKEAHCWATCNICPVPEVWQLPPRNTFEPLTPIRRDEYRKETGIDGSRFWVLSVGNNRYPTGPLGGCIRDTVLFQHYCRKYLGVPEANMTRLKNARRESMIEALYDLRDDPRIQRGDIIVFQYSGHGSSYDPVTYAFPGPLADIPGSIEALCPVDRDEFVPDISDRELNTILNDVHTSTRANVVAILDCCHSGGAIRVPDEAEDQSDWATRYISPLMYRTDEEQSSDLDIMLSAGDTNPRRRKDTPLINDGAWVPNMDQLVLMAACQDFQLAGEGELEVPVELTSNAGSPSSKLGKRYYGRFTWFLVNVLMSDRGQNQTFESVVQSIGQFAENQVPVVLGGRKTSRLWFQGE